MTVKDRKKFNRIVPDTSVIVEGLLSQWLSSKELQCREILIHEAVLAELESQANKNRETGYLGLDEIKQLRDISKKQKIQLAYKGDRPSEFEIKRAKTGEIDALIRALARQEKATLITADRVQALVAESQGIDVHMVEFTVDKKAVPLAHFFDDATMSVHIKEGCTVKAKKGKPGSWKYVVLQDKPLDREGMKELSKEIVEVASGRQDGFIELERRGSTIIQLANYRIVITKPPLSDGYEITAVRPVKKLSLPEYKLSDKLKQRLAEQAEGILIAGAPGMGKSTFIQALAEYYLRQEKVVKTLEAPRDLVLSDDITQYAMSHGTAEELHDILLLSRPDYTLFDEMRNTPDFRMFADLRLSGVGMVGVVHATKPIDAIQRFIGRLELGVIPHVVDTVIFIHNGEISNVFSLHMEVKVPTGMTEADLARPIVVVHNFETGRLEFEIYSYGEETIVVPIGSQDTTPARALAEEHLAARLKKLVGPADVEMVSDHKCIVYVPDHKRASIIGKGGKTITEIERKLGVSIDVRGRTERVQKPPSIGDNVVPFNVKIDKKNILFQLGPEYSEKDTAVFVDDDFLLTAKTSKKGMIKISKTNKLGKMLIAAVNDGDVELRQ